MSVITSTKKWLLALGLNPKNTIKAITKLPKYFRDKKILNHQLRISELNFPLGISYPSLFDEEDEGGNAKGHYFHQDLFVARKIFNNKPKKHVDVGSRIDGFVAHVASFREIEVFDIRKMKSNIPNIKFQQADMMQELDKNLYNYTDSLSCLHTLEHFGLGRYGDNVKVDGFLVGLQNLNNLLKSGGKFYLSVPIGPQRIEFNAHRVFSMKYILEILQAKFLIDSFSFVDDNGDLFENVNLSEPKINDNYDCNYGCGIFELTKI